MQIAVGALSYLSGGMRAMGYLAVGESPAAARDSRTLLTQTRWIRGCAGVGQRRFSGHACILRSPAAAARPRSSPPRSTSIPSSPFATPTRTTRGRDAGQLRRRARLSADLGGIARRPQRPAPLACADEPVRPELVIAGAGLSPKTRSPSSASATFGSEPSSRATAASSPPPTRTPPGAAPSHSGPGPHSAGATARCSSGRTWCTRARATTFTCRFTQNDVDRAGKCGR
jgi:hypothetical protein